MRTIAIALTTLLLTIPLTTTSRADTAPATPTLARTATIDLPLIDTAIVVYIWSSDRPLELRWSTGDVEIAPAGRLLRITRLSHSLDAGGGWLELSVSAHELTGGRVAGWAWAWLRGGVFLGGAR